MRQIELLRNFSKLAAWGSLAFVAFATLSPIELRPVVAKLNVQHIGAFAAIGLLFGIGYPKHLRTIALLVAVAAIGLEAAQNFIPGRHARVIDLAFKLVGGGLGLATAAAANAWLRARILAR